MNSKIAILAAVTALSIFLLAGCGDKKADGNVEKTTESIEVLTVTEKTETSSPVTENISTIVADDITTTTAVVAEPARKKPHFYLGYYDETDTGWKELIYTDNDGYTSKYTYDNKGNQLAYELYDEKDKLLEKETYKYNPNDTLFSYKREVTDDKSQYSYVEYRYDVRKNMVSEKHFIVDGSVDYYINYTYDEDNKSIKEETYWVSASKDSEAVSCEVITIIYTYKKNLLVKEETFADGICTYVCTYKHDNKGNAIEQYSKSNYSMDPEVKSFHYELSKMQYDKNGNIVKEEYYDGYEEGNLTLGSITEYKYDQNNDLIEQIFYDGNKTPYLINVYKYDKYENIILEEEYEIENGKKTLSSKTVYEYEYKSQNAVTMTHSLYGGKGNLISKYVTEYKYFPKTDSK